MFCIYLHRAQYSSASPYNSSSQYYIYILLLYSVDCGEFPEFSPSPLPPYVHNRSRGAPPWAHGSPPSTTSRTQIQQRNHSRDDHWWLHNHYASKAPTISLLDSAVAGGFSDVISDFAAAITGFRDAKCYIPLCSLPPQQPQRALDGRSSSTTTSACSTQRPAAGRPATTAAETREA